MALIVLILFTAFLFFIVYSVNKISQQPISITSHWRHNCDGLQFSSQEFYKGVEEAIKKRSVPNVKLSRVTYRQGGIFSYSREYLRVARNEHVFDICAAPFGTDFFVSWWLGQSYGGLLARIPVLNNFFGLNPNQKTYYQMDTENMFRESVHACVVSVLEDITKAKGVRGLTELERMTK